MRRIFPRQESFDSGASQRTIIAHPNNVVYSDEKQTIDPDTPLEGSDGADNRSMLPEKSSGLLSVSELSKDDNATTKTSFRSASPFRGLPEYRIDPFKITINDILDGIQVRGQMRSQDGDKEVVPLDTASMTGDPTTPPESGDEGLKREGRKQSKERRPELQVSIPQSKLRGPATSTLRAEDKRTKQPSGASAVSPASTTTSTTLPSNKQFPGVSPLSVVNPQPRRPLSTQSLEGRTVPDQTTDTTVASMSKGLENASQHDRGVRVLHSPTSISTNAHTNTNTNTSGTQTRMVSAKADLDRRVIQAKEGRLVQGQEDDCATVPDSVDGRTQPPVAESLRTTAAFVSAATTSASAYLPTTTSTTTTTTTTTTATVTASPPPPPVRPGLHSKHSNTSIVTVSSTRSTRTLDRNKPLPPEPDHANRIARSPSRSSTLTARQRIMPLPLGSNGDFTNAPGVSRVKSKGSASLRSRYTPKDLDALDEAFQQPLPVKHQTTSSYSSNSTPTLSQVTLALEHQLGTIQEALPARTVASPSSSDPLQISRGPMRMEPSRRAPQPPGRPSSPPHYTQDYRRRIMRRAASSNHVITQMRVAETIPHRRASTTASTAPSSKAMRILGEKSGAKTPVRMERKNSMDSNWSSSDSPQMYTSATSPDLEEEEEEVESLTPESELSSIPDAHFEEIRKRLELLSPKDDPSRTFHAFHQKNAPRSTEKLTQYRDHSAKAGNEHGPPSHKPAEIRIPEHIAELEGNQIPSPVELEDTQRMAPVELGPPSPLPMPMITAPVTLPPPMPPPPPPPPPAVSSTAGDTRLLERRGRADELSPHSAATSVKSRSFHSNRSMKARSLASLAMSEIPDLYAAIPSPENVLRPSMTAEEVEHLMFADAAERVLLRILQSLDNLEDLFAAAEVSRGFYRTFKRHELPLIKNALWCMSPAAWELREMSVPFAELEHGASDYEPSMYLQHYKRDIVTMVPLKGMILDHCKSFLRPETISGLSGETDRSPFIDDAFWRVWTFCRIFGCGKGREDDIVGQMDWLRGGVLAIQQSTDTNTLSLSDGIVMNSVLFNPPAGFARGNHRGLTAEELYDMNEIWICLGVLVRGFHGRRKEAREYGIFDGTHIAPGDVEKENAALEEWTYHLLTLAPAVILDITAPTSPEPATFAHARAQGYTKWTPPTHPTSRSTFLKEAVTRVYEEQMTHRRPALPVHNAPASLPLVAASPQLPLKGSPDLALASRQRCAVHAAEIRAKRQDPTYRDVPISEERPMSNYPDVLAKLEAANAAAGTAPPVPKIPGLAAKLSRRRTKPTVATSPTTQPKSPSQSTMKSGGSSNPGSPCRHKASRFAPKPRSVASPTADTLPWDRAPSHDHHRPVPQVPLGPQVRDPVDVAVEKLTALGFDETVAKKALAETDTGHSVSFERAVSRLMKQRERQKIMNRLDRMG